MISQIQILDFLRTNKDYLKSEFGVNRIALFGSFARNENSEESDIDLMVELSDHDFMKWSGLLNYLQNNFKKKVDLITEGKHVSERFNRIIKNEKIYA